MNRTCIASAILLCIATVARADNLALDDRSGIFSGAARGGSASMAYQDFWLEPLGSECLHNLENYLDYEAAFSPAIFGVGITPQMLDGFTLNTNGSLRLTLGIDDWAEGSVTVGAPPLLWGELYGWASIHRCSGGVQEMCYACGRRHSSDDGYDCSHDMGCAARTSYANGCTCSPLLVRVNWDDDNWNFSEDRLDTNPCAGDDETEGFRAIGVGRYCCCHGDISGTTSVSELTGSSELRLWNGSTAASSSASAFAIEAIAASSGIGGATISYEIRDETNGFLRAITRQVTAANLEIRPDFNDDGAVDNYDRFYFDDGGTWQLRVREEPYKFALVSECPSAATASLLAVQAEGTGTVIRTETTGGTILPLNTISTSPLFAAKNETKELFVDTSGGPGTTFLHYSLGFGGTHSPLTATRQIHIVDANVHEEWATTNSLADLVYNFSDVLGDIYWTIYDNEDNVVDYGDDSSFTPIDLPPGNYTVEVYFADVYEDGILGYTSSAALHVVTVEHGLFWETNNKANQILNTTYKDDYTGNNEVREEEVVNGRLCTYGAPRNFLYVVENAASNAFLVTERLNITPSNANERVLCAAYVDGTLIGGSCTNASESGDATMIIPRSTGSSPILYEIRAGVDTDNDGILSFSESEPLKIYSYNGTPRHLTLKAIPNATYNQNEAFISALVSGVSGLLVGLDLPVGRSFLSIFYNEGANALSQTWQPSSFRNDILLNAFADSTGFAEWLTHNSGAQFNESGVTNITEYTWLPDSQMARFFEGCAPFVPWHKQIAFKVGEYDELVPYERYVPTETGARITEYFENVLKPIAELQLANATNGATLVFSPDNGWDDYALITNVFTSASPSNVVGITQVVGALGEPNSFTAVLAANVLDFITGENQVDNLDAFFAVGRGRLENPSYGIKVKKCIPAEGNPTIELHEISFSCTILDLYDFNYEDGTLSSWAATLQIGFGNGANQHSHGRIYRHRIQINTVYSKNPEQ